MHFENSSDHASPYENHAVFLVQLMFVRVVAFIIHGSIVLIEAVFISVNFRLETAAMVAKSDIAATRLRYEQQVYNLQTELNSLQVN